MAIRSQEMTVSSGGKHFYQKQLWQKFLPHCLSSVIKTKFALDARNIIIFEKTYFHHTISRTLFFSRVYKYNFSAVFHGLYRNKSESVYTICELSSLEFQFSFFVYRQNFVNCAKIHSVRHCFTDVATTATSTTITMKMSTYSLHSSQNLHD